MDKEKSQKRVRATHPKKYSKDIVDKVISLVREGKTLKEILSQVPCKKTAVRRYARKVGLVIKRQA